MSEQNFNYQNWFNALKSITDIYLLIQSLDITPESKTQIWKNMLLVLKEQQNPLKETELTEESLFSVITENIDLEDREEPDPRISKLYEIVRNLAMTPQSDVFWNESISKLIEFFIKNYSAFDSKALIPIEDNHDITIDDLKNSDAGNNFPLSRESEDKWVRPWWNIDNESYDDVRKSDEVIDTLKNDKKIQFTREYDESSSIAKWIRLLMPQYGRRVEVEDLDRNFWVIAQVIAAISAYLFDGNNPLAKTLEGLLRETSEIWENVMYLWIQAALMSQTTKDNVRVIVLPLQSDIYEHDKKYDNIYAIAGPGKLYSYELVDEYPYIFKRADNFDEEVVKRIDYLKDRFSNENLVVIPYIRINNYKHNFYAGEWYPSVYYYVQGSGEWKATPIKEKITKGTETIYREFIISPRYDNDYNTDGELIYRFSDKIYASRINNDNVLYSFPFSTSDITGTDGRQFFLYGALRTDPIISAKYTSSGIELSSAKIFVYDAARYSIDKVNERIGQYDISKSKTEDMYISTYKPVAQYPYPSIERNTVLYKKITPRYPHYYQGEIPSWQHKTLGNKQTDNLFNSIAHVIKIGSYLPKKGTNELTFRTAQMGNGEHTLMRGNLTTLINADNNSKGNTLPLNLNFYLNNWTTYNPNLDLVGQSGDACCFTSPPTAYGCGSVDETFLEYWGLKSVKEYLRRSNKLDQPCYVITAIGLTPWDNGNRYYWDASGICHIYHYIPSSISLAEKPSDDSYDSVYNQYEKIIVTSSNNYREDGDIYTNRGEVAGKIISCHLINRWDSFFNKMNMVSTSSTAYIAPRWRQFQVVSKNEEVCKCYKYTSEESPDKKYVTYSVKFATDFKGDINYYDNRWALQNHRNVFSTGSQVGTAPNIHIYKGTSGDIYTQESNGIISSCKDGKPIAERGNNIALNSKNTGFGTISGKNFMKITSGEKEDAYIINSTAHHIYSNTTN